MKGLSFNFLSEYFPLFIEGLLWTLLIALLAVIFGVILGSNLCFMKKSTFILLRAIAHIYIEIVRGTPVLLQVYIVYFGLTAFGIKLGAFTSAIIALSVNSAAYVAEIIRSGIEAVDSGQMEAARSLGMTSKMAMFNIILPQAIKNILPAIGNEFVAVIKESSMASVIGVAEIMYASKIVTGATYRSMEPLMIAAIFYFILTFTLGRLMGYLERRLKASDSR